MNSTYDAYYLALAEIWECEFWTADTRLYRHVKEALPYIQCLQQE